MLGHSYISYISCIKHQLISRRIIVVDFDCDVDDHDGVDDNDIANYKMIICNDDYIGIIIYDIIMLFLL